MIGDNHTHPMTKHRVSVQVAKPNIEPNNLIFEQLCEPKVNKSQLNKYRPQLNIMKNTYSINNLEDYQILKALCQTNGNIDEALEILFTKLK
jgi:hypothetical protein